ncbi:hypothetical protein BASA81_007882 [Batrachochytrium salamandrivorans]|nr:hypothetical protein BASA81_007882 [Batrachochytrium salamandrivorans]
MYLDQHGGRDMEITLISPRQDFFLYKVSGLRLATTSVGDEDGWANRTMIPLDKLFTHSRHRLLQDWVTKVDSTNKQVELKSSSPIGYDVLVICTGGQNFSPGEPPAHIVSKEDTKQYYDKFRSALKQTNNVVVLGSGATGLELCGELRQYYPKMIITIVTRSSGALQAGGATPGVPISFAKRITRKLHKLKIDLIPGDEPEEGAARFEENEPWLVPEGGELKLKSGAQIKCDLLVSAVGFKPNTQFLPEDWVDSQSKRVVVNEFGQVKGEQEVYCFGDCAKSGAQLLGYLASMNAQAVGKNILQRGEPTHKIALQGKGFVLPLGDSHGRLVVMGWQFGDVITSLVKGRGLFTMKHWMGWGHSLFTLPTIPHQPSLVRHTLALPFGGV